MLYMFQTDFSSIITSSKLHIQRQAFVRPLLLAAGSSNGKLPVKPAVCLCTKSTKFAKTVTHSYKLKCAYTSMHVTDN